MVHSGKDSIHRMMSAFDSPPSPQNKESSLVDEFIVFPVNNSLEEEIIQILRYAIFHVYRVC